MTGIEGIEGDSRREQLKNLADELSVDVDELLLQSRRRSIQMKGTTADHKKAQWFAQLWSRAVEGRDTDEIHVRGVHYFVVMAGDEEFGLGHDQIPVDIHPDDLPTLPDELLKPPTPGTSWDRYQHTDRCYKYMNEAAKLARILGYIPLDGVIDEKHNQWVVTRYRDHERTPHVKDKDVPTGVSTPTIPDVDDRAELRFDPDEQDFAEWAGEYIATHLRDDLEFDVPSQAPYHLELWSEKTLPDYITRIAKENGVNAVVEGEGDLSLTIANDFVQRVESAEKPAVVLYLSDHDPKGDSMARNMAAKIAWLKQRGDLQNRVFVDQLAVTAEQVDRYGLPVEPLEDPDGSGSGAKAYKSLSLEWAAQTDHDGICELNALEAIPDLYKQIVRDGLDPYVDPDIPTKNRYAKRAWEQQVAARITARLRDQSIDEDLNELQAWIHQFNDRLEDAASILEDLHDFQDEGFIEEWEERVTDTVEDINVPAVEVPAGDGAAPDDPLYDSERPYLQNVKRVKE